MRRRVERTPVQSPTPIPTVPEAGVRAEGVGDLFLCAQCHLDSAWLWTWDETVEKAVATFGRQLGFLRRFARYAYSQSQAQLYAWVEARDPALFAQVQRYVREGRWHVVGGMWVEPDTWLLRGESLARQLLHGQRYFLGRFGRAARVAWLPDTFGFSPMLPALLRQAGIDAFVTTKMLWNDTTAFPHNLFWWEAPDGSRVLAYQTPDVLGRTNMVRLLAAVRRFGRRNATPHVLLLYGEGDGGHGPKHDEVWQVQGLDALGRRGLLPPIHQAGPEAYFEAVRREPDIPVVRGELYLEYHRGAFVTDGFTKSYNRRCEDMLLAAEALSTFAGGPYPREALQGLWRRLLLNQGHDTICGTVVRASQAEGHAAFREILEGGARLVEAAVAGAVRDIGLRAPSLVVLNPLAFARDDVVAVDLPDAGAVAHLPQQRGRDVVGRESLYVLARGVPSLGYRAFPLGEGAQGDGCGVGREGDRIVIEAAGRRVAMDATTGLLVSVRHDGHEMLAGEANLLQLFVDRPLRWDAWNIDPGTLDRPPLELRAAERVEVVESGPLRTVVRIERRHRRTRIVQHVIVYAELPRIEFETWIDWHEVRRLLKVAFPIQVRSRVATYEVPFGAVERATHPATPAEAAQFEAPHLRWVDLSEATHGVSLLNDGRYSSDVRGSTIRLSLLRAPLHPTRVLPEAVRPAVGGDVATVDRGVHRLRYALLPHLGNWREAGVPRQAAAFDQPLLAVTAPPHGGPMPPAGSWLEVEPIDGVAVEAVKQAEDGPDVVVRLYETHQRGQDVTLRFSRPIAEATQTDLLERSLCALPCDGQTLRLTLGPSEIRTVRMRF